MLTQAFPKLKNNFFCACIRDFFRSPAYAAVVVILMVLAETLGLEIEVYYFYLALLFFGFLFTEDTLCAVPIACCGYMTVSPRNSPYKYPKTTVFADQVFLIQFIAILSLAVFLLMAKLVMLCIHRYHRSGERPAVPRLWGGFVALGAAYMLGGVFSSHYSLATVGFGFVQFLSLALLYGYFFLTVDWKRVKKSYFAILFLMIGIGLIVQIADMYTLENVFVDGSVDRRNMFTGWGVYNNVACILAMCIPAPCYFAIKKKHGWPFTVLATFFYIGVIFTQSRGGILFGFIVYVVSMLWIVFSTKGRSKQAHLAVLIFFSILLLLACIVMRELLNSVFASLVEIGADSNNRNNIYRRCWEVFLKNPWFGVGFYDTPGVTFDKLSYFMSPRAHNTYIQLLATGGVTCLLTYLYHRIQTLFLLFKHPSHEKMFVAISILALLLTSIVDCNFFNIGPAIIYGILLASVEGFDNLSRKRPMAAGGRR